jgi:site-specific recombinase XerD
MNNNEWLTRYLTALDVELGYGGNTLATYGRILRDFLRFLDSRRTSVRRLRSQDLQSYVQMLRSQRANSARSIRLKLQAIRSFLSYLGQHGAGPRGTLVGDNDFRYKVEQRQAESLSQSQLAALLDTVQRQVEKAREAAKHASKSERRETKRLFAAQRDLCLLTLLASTGLRISEALGITFADIDPVDKSILILGKGKKYRKVFFDLPALEDVLQDYLTARQALGVDHDVLFVSTKTYRPLQPRGVQKALKGHLRSASLSCFVSPHTFRHSFATLAIERGANIKAVSQILGHANCSITINLYTHLSNEHLRQVMQLCSPLSTVQIPLEERIQMRKQHLAYIEKTG